MKKNRYFLLGLLVVIFFSKSFSQDYSKTRNNIVTFPSPKAWSFLNYGNYSVSHYTGTVDVSTELFNERVQNFDLRLGISYNFLDNKPSMLPSQLGLGMSLDIGGCVTRVVRGIPDEKNGFITHGGNRLIYEQSIGEYISGVLDRRIDNAPDIFYYKFGNYSGSFYFDHNKKIVHDNFSNMKIEVIDVYSEIHGVVLIDPYGVKYEFKDFEQSTYYSQNVGMKGKYNSAWWLSKVTFPNSETINFEYYPKQFDLLNGNYLMSYDSFQEDGIIQVHVTDNIHIVSFQNRTHFETYLKKITFQNGSINFSISNRQDKGGTKAKKIDEITILNNKNELIKRYNFEFYENQTERFKLKKIVESNATESIILREFVYNNLRLPWNSDNDAPYYSEAVDYWGFYNEELRNIGQSPIPLTRYNNRDYGKAIRTPKLNAAKAEILEKIIYPTGGFTTFEYELNDFSQQGESYSPLAHGQFEDVRRNFFYDQGSFSEDPYGINFTLDEKTTVSLIKHAKVEPAGTKSKWINRLPGQNYEEKILELAAGTYNLGDLFNTNYLLHNDNADIITADGLLTYKYKIQDNNPSSTGFGGGLRISKVVNNDGTKKITKRYQYTTTLESNISSGILTLMPTYFVNGADLSINGYFSSSNPILSYNESEIIGYANVFEILDDGSYTQYNYTSFIDYPDEIYDPLDNVFFKRLLCPRISSKNWRGKLREKKSYSADHKLLLSEEFIYSTLSDERTKSISYILVNPLFAITRVYAGGGTFSDNVSFTFSSLYSKMVPFLVLSKKYVKDFSASSPIIYTEEYEYLNPQHSFPTATKSMDSRGINTTNLNIYPMDYSTGTEELLSKNIVASPIENVVYKTSGNVTNIISSQLSTIDNFGMLSEVFELNKKTLLTDFKFSNQVKGKIPDLKAKLSFSPDPNYYSVLKVLNKTQNNKPLELRKLANHTTYLWGYGGQYPIAEIKNANYADVLAVLTQETINNLNAVNVTEATITTAMNKLRTDTRLAKAMVTSYTYQPLVGMRSKTDTRGVTEFYEYDGMQRLKAILDHVKNVTSAMDYHYRPN